MGVLATVIDPDGRRVDLTEDRWRHIVGAEPFRAGHPELAPLRDAVMETIRTPDRRTAGRAPDQEWFYLEGVGPSRFLKVVVAYDGDRGRVITAFARRSIP